MPRPTINVIDMYHGNAVKNPDFAALKGAGVFGIIHKASQGAHYADPAYAGRRKAAQDAGLLWGAYHFLTNADAKAQADWFLKCSGISAINSDPILLAADFENSSAQPALHQLREFMAEVDQAVPGVQCVLYSGNLIRETLTPPAPGHTAPDMRGVNYFFQQHRLWLAEYGPRENIPYPWNETVPKSSDEATPIPAPGVWLWQFTETGRVNPLVGKTDGNYFDGTFEQLSQRWLA